MGTHATSTQEGPARLATACGLALLALLVALRPVEGTALALGLAALAAIAVRPELGTLAVCFVLYTNLAVVAVTFHGVPFVLGAAFPLLLGAPLYQAVVVRREPFVIPPATPFIVLYIFAQVLGMVFSDEPRVAFTQLTESFLEGVVIYFGVANAIRSVDTLVRVNWTLLAAGVVIGGVPLFQYLTGNLGSELGGLGQIEVQPDRVGFERRVRLAGPIGEINRYAQVLLALLPIGLYRAFSHTRSSGRALALGATAIVAAGLALAFSRGAAVGLGILFVTMVLLRAVSWRQAAIAVLVGAIGMAAFPQYRARLQTIPNSIGLVAGESTQAADGAMFSRFTVMIAAWHAFLDHPIVGVGPGMFPSHSEHYVNQLDMRRLRLPRPAHSLPLGLAAETGILGLGAFSGAVLVTLVGLLRLRRRCAPEHVPLVLAAALAIVAYLAAGLFLHLAYVRFFWLIMALGAATQRVVEQASGHRESEAPA